jgi:hypothetical protein
MFSKRKNEPVPGNFLRRFQVSLETEDEKERRKCAPGVATGDKNSGTGQQ